MGDKANFKKRLRNTHTHPERYMPLSDAACRNAKPNSKVYKITDGAGLCLRIMPYGSKYWTFRYRIAGHEKNLSLGIYPEVPLAEARKKRDDARQSLRQGVDPAISKVKQKLKINTNQGDSFEEVARDWLKNKKLELSPRYASQIESRLESDVFPFIGRLPCREITAPMLLAVLKKVQARGTFETMHRLKQYCGMILSFAIVCGKAEHNAAIDLRNALPSPKKHNFAAIDSADLPELLLKMSDNTISVGVQTRLAMRLLMLTFVRTGELIGAKWEEFDFTSSRWIIPKTRMKMKRDHIVPLSRQAIEILIILKKLGKGDYVFPGQHSWQKPMSNMAILMALKRMGYKGKMTGHGFRALANTTLREILDFDKDIIDLQLAHARGKVEAAYDRSKFIKKRTEMMQRWADYLDEIEREARQRHFTA